MPLAAPTKFAHIVYRTRRFQEMLEWYSTVFDARIQYKNPALAFMTYDDEHHRFAFADMNVLQPNGGETEKSGAIGVDHVGYTLGSVDALLENYASLKEKGISPYWCVHHGVTVSMYYADPDGNQMEFQVDLMDSSEDASELMATRFDTNPIGVEYDPDQMLAGHRAGVSHDELLRFYEGGEVSPIRGEFARLVSA